MFHINQPTVTGTVGSIVNTNVPALFEPLDQHVQTILGKLVTEHGSLLVVMAEVFCGVIFLDTTPREGY